MSYQVNISYPKPEKLSRGILILRLLFGGIYVGIPHFFLLYFRLIGTAVVGIIAWFAILFTGKYPKGMFNFVFGTTRWSNNVYAYLTFLTDVYPPFSGKEEIEYPVKTTITYPEKLSRGILFLRLFFSIFYVGIPHGFLLFFRLIANTVIGFIAWFAILFTGKYPEKMFNFNLGTLRWITRVGAYMGYMTDEYPPFTGKE